MRYAVLALLSCCFLSGAATVSADDVVVLDCGQKSLADAVTNARDDRRTVILFTGTCAGPIAIRTDGLTIIGVSPAIIDGGGGGDAVTVNGAGRVALAYLEVRNGVNGIRAANGAHLTLDQGNAGIGDHDRRGLIDVGHGDGQVRARLSVAVIYCDGEFPGPELILDWGQSQKAV